MTMLMRRGQRRSQFKNSLLFIVMLRLVELRLQSLQLATEFSVILIHHSKTSIEVQAFVAQLQLPFCLLCTIRLKCFTKKNPS